MQSERKPSSINKLEKKSEYFYPKSSNSASGDLCYRHSMHFTFQHRWRFSKRKTMNTSHDLHNTYTYVQQLLKSAN